MLTRKQYELLAFINDRLQATGVPPSFDEMKDALGLASKSGIHRLVTGLEERGFIRRLPHRARAMEVLKLPDDGLGRDKAVARGAERRSGSAGFAATVIQGNFKPAFSGAVADSGAQAVSLPLYGKIAAGTPIEALRDHSASIGVPASMLASGEHYALEVVGDSMIDAGILSGDVVVINRCDTAENGAIVVALVDDQEVTLKRLRRKGASIALEPANQTFETRIFGPDRVKVQGRLVGLVRRY
jgi:repressor LexA